MIYLDNAGTTKMDESACEVYKQYATQSFFNPSAIYRQSAQIKKDIDGAKQTVANALGTTFADNIIFTPSATCANNLAIKGAYRKNFGKMVFSAGEHPSVYNVAMEFKNQGLDVEFVNLTKTGEVDYEDLKNKLTPNTSFISIMHISNETGAINDLKKISEIKNQICPKAIFHSDGVQAFTKTKINVEYFGVDMYTIAGHKINGPKGIGALYVKNLNLINPIIHGGGQEYNLWSGTENVAGTMALKCAIENSGDVKQKEQKIRAIKKAFLDQIDFNQNITLNCEQSPYIISLSFAGVNGETLVHMMEQQNILISRGSACSAKKAGNRILENMGLSKQQILGSVRISFDKNSSFEEAIIAGQKLNECYKQLINVLK